MVSQDRSYISLSGKENSQVCLLHTERATFTTKHTLLLKVKRALRDEDQLHCKRETTVYGYILIILSQSWLKATQKISL